VTAPAGSYTIAQPLLELAIPIDDVHLDPANARRHNKRSQEAVKASLASNGQLKPIVVQADGMIVRAGNGTVEAARSLGWTHIAAVVVDRSTADMVAFAIQDNRSAELSAWDDTTLTRLLDALKEDHDVRALGFTSEELRRLAGGDALDGGTWAERPVIDLPDTATATAGEVWQLGQHRLLCGDSKDSASYAHVPAQVAMLVTDPPYGVEYRGVVGQRDRMHDDGTSGLRDLLRASLTLAVGRVALGGPCYIFAPPGPQFLDFATVLTELQVWRQTLAWVKDTFVVGRSDYHYRHEAIFYGWRPGAKHVAPPTRKLDTVWEADRQRSSPNHPTMKPVQLFARAIVNSSSEGDAVLDPFAGSGTAIIAAEKLDRTCYSIEIDPRYVDVAVSRWESLTGKKADR
jgi:DNA modification methylase